MRWFSLLLLTGCVGLPQRGDVDSLNEPDHLALAAEHLDRGELSKAITHLTAHVRTHPDEVMTRAYLAELLFQSKRYDEAAAEFEEVIAAAQPMTGKPHDHLVHCHTRLMSIAEERGDEYREHLHRGIGLLRLVERWEGDSKRREDNASEATLVQALSELKAAEREKPKDARVHFYFAEVSSRLGQTAAASASVRKANALPPIGMTVNERQRLEERIRGLMSPARQN
jgi:tetratricopeptide (TPR) repeat protein